MSRVKARVDEINAKGMLPDGLKIVPYYDRSELVDAALWTVTKVLLEGVVLVVVVLFLFLGDLRSEPDRDRDAGAHAARSRSW